MKKPERMSDFFAARVTGYEAHMLSDVVGCYGAYVKMAELIPENTETLLDLGCGTGLELDFIYKRFPNLRVTGIDLTTEMLDVLIKKHAAKRPRVICGDYFTEDFGDTPFDCAISFESLHHFKKAKKLSLYKRIHGSLADGGCYIECDYVVDSDEEEAEIFARSDAMRAEYGIGEDEYMHIDTPCTVENQLALMTEAGFRNVKLCFKDGGTAIIMAEK